MILQHENWVPTYKGFGNIFCQEAEGAMENAVDICKCGYHQIWHQATGGKIGKMCFFPHRLVSSWISLLDM